MHVRLSDEAIEALNRGHPRLSYPLYLVTAIVFLKLFSARPEAE
jgi:hypothetical protein